MIYDAYQMLLTLRFPNDMIDYIVIFGDPSRYNDEMRRLFDVTNLWGFDDKIGYMAILGDILIEPDE